jgi:hypothetical protein
MVSANGTRYAASHVFDNPFARQGRQIFELGTNFVIQTARSKILLYPYYTILFGGLAGKLLSDCVAQQSKFRAFPDVQYRVDVHDEPHGSRTQDVVRQELGDDRPMGRRGLDIPLMAASGRLLYCT